MRKTSMLTTVLAAGVLVLSGCGSDGSGDTVAADSSAGADSSSSAAAPSSSAASSASSSADAALSTANNPRYGTIVVDSKGMTVYMFDKDTQGSGASTCSGQCLVAWPPVIADSATPPVDGVTGEVGSITRDDGTTQMTLDGWPLYYWQGDAAPGDATGQGVQNVWWVLSPDGARVTTPPSS